MGIDVLPKNHYSLSTFPDVNEICQPFFKKNNINAFIYCRIFNDGTFYSLATNLEYYQYHVKKEYRMAPPVSTSMLQQKFYYMPLIGESKQYDQLLNELNIRFNIAYPYYIFERYPGYFDMTVFSSYVNNSNIINFYLNYKDELENFKDDFVERADKLIIKSKFHKILLPEHMRPNFQGLNKNANPTQCSLKVLINENIVQSINNIKDNKIYLTKDPKQNYLTNREFECIKWIIYGKTAEEIGLILGLSNRTIEKYIENIKNKFSCTKITQLIYKLARYGMKI